MKRTRRPFSEHETGEIWRRWRAGESISEIGRALGKKAPTIFGVLAARGGIAPSPSRRSSRALSVEEREEISRGLAAEKSLRAIATNIGRAPSTVSREIKRNGGRDQYRAANAEARALKRSRRPKALRLSSSTRLRRIVTTKLESLWSPEQIAGWLRITYANDPTMWVSHESIYRAVYLRHRGVFDRSIVRCLRSHRVMRRSKKATTAGQTRGQIVDAVSIRDRPRVVEKRRQFGHWEGDLISGSKNTHIATLVERRSRTTMLVRVEAKDATTVAASLTRALLKLPPPLRRSLTWDRGTELAKHAELTRATGIPIFFCDPQSPWQRGSNENTNGLLRQYFPKGTPLDSFTQRQLNAVAADLNRRPRKLLGFRTPSAILRAALR